jgi:hypothetical protein
MYDICFWGMLCYTHTAPFHNRGFRTLCVDLLVPVPIVQETGWAPRGGLDTEARGKIILSMLELEPRSSGRPVRSQTLYWLSYPGSQTPKITCQFLSKI